MKLAGAFFRLIRFPNLFFIALTQFLFYYCILLPSFGPHSDHTEFGWAELAMVMAASVSIAAGGYIINDYFDLNIDRVNKPGKLVIDRIIRRRWAIVWHMSISFAGLVFSGWVSVRIHNMLPLFFNAITVLMLWFYSTTFKRKLLIGNVIISLLTAWVLLILYVCVSPLRVVSVNEDSFRALTRIYKFAVLYGGFAFIISLIREVIKDMEDMEGDERYGCRTMPVVWGLPSSKIFVSVWNIVLIGAMAVLQVYALQLGWWWSVAYCLAFIIMPLVFLQRRLFPAVKPEHFHELSTLVKLVMLTGILSMLLIKWYTR